MQQGEKLTTQDYWEKYYSNSKVNKKNIVNVCSYYDEFWDELIDKGNSNNQSIIEIGGFPGRYLAYLGSKYGLKPTCLDYNSETREIEDSFKVMGVVDYTIIQEDFFNYDPPVKYDYVISNGFIEHFENYDEVLDLHLKYLKPGGKMLIMIPNKRGYIKLYRKLVDIENLRIHNLKCMKLDVFKAYAKRSHIKIRRLTYFGDFPHSVHQDLNAIQKIIFKIHQKSFKLYLNKFVKKYPSRNFSSTIVAIFENV
jgi:SAM-dependent methyltransferase